MNISSSQRQQTSSSLRAVRRLLLVTGIAVSAAALLYPASFILWFDLAVPASGKLVPRITFYIASVSALIYAAASLTLAFLGSRVLTRLIDVLTAAIVVTFGVRPLWRWWTIESGDRLQQTMYGILPMILVTFLLTPWCWARFQRLSWQISDERAGRD